MERFIKYDIDQSGIATVTLDSQDTKLNVLSTPFMESLDQTLDSLVSEQGVKIAVFHSGKSAGFIAGANLDEIEALTTAEEA
ncbi:MAG: 3-hydroxyacyl-CoA dehydrogenase, partial [Calditrichota bacterium]